MLLHIMSQKMRWMKSMNPRDNLKRTPLEICAFVITAIAVAIIFLSFSHIVGIGILAKIFPSVPEPQPITLYPRSIRPF
jgi:hypothetical protein